MVKKSELASRILGGEIIVLLEYRSSKVEVIKSRGKDGRPRDMILLRHSCETVKSEQVQVNEWLPDGTDPKAVSIAFKKGQLVALNLRALEEMKGVKCAAGTLEPVEG